MVGKKVIKKLTEVIANNNITETFQHGASITFNGKLIGNSSNNSKRSRILSTNVPSCHAEVISLSILNTYLARKTCRKLQRYFEKGRNICL